MQIEFSDEEFRELQEMVGMWVCEGFTTPPYTRATYGIFRKLELDPIPVPTHGCNYDLTEPPSGEASDEGERPYSWSK